MIVLDTATKIWIELIKLQNDNAMESSIGSKFFFKSWDLVEISKISKNRKNNNSIKGALLLYELSSGNLVDGSPLVAIETRVRATTLTVLEWFPAELSTKDAANDL